MSAIEVVNLYNEMGGQEEQAKGKEKVFPHVV